mgnify:CR=1 FL=1
MTKTVDLLVTNGRACYWIQIVGGIIRDAAPIARRWIGKSFIEFVERKQFTKLELIK